MPMEGDISVRRRISFQFQQICFNEKKCSLGECSYGVHGVQSIAMKYEIQKIEKIHPNNGKKLIFPEQKL